MAACLVRQVWDFVLAENDSRLVTGSGDSELRVYALHFSEGDGDPPAKAARPSTPDGQEEATESDRVSVLRGSGWQPDLFTGVFSNTRLSVENRCLQNECCM